MHLVLKWCSFPFLPSVRKANLTEDPLWNASSLGFLQGRGDLIWSRRACGPPAPPCPVGGQPNDQERIRGFHTHRPHHTEWLLARHTQKLPRVLFSLVLTKSCDKNRRENGKASWGKRRPICSFLTSPVFVRPWTGTPSCDLTPPWAS